MYTVLKRLVDVHFPGAPNLIDTCIYNYSMINLQQIFFLLNSVYASMLWRCSKEADAYYI